MNRTSIPNNLSNKIKQISFVSIILVIFIHSYNVGNFVYPVNGNLYKLNFILQNFISQGISRIAVPFFYMISGYLFFISYKSTKDSYLKKIKNRFKSLFVPFVLWSCIGLILYLVIQSVPFTAIFFNNKLIRDYSLYDYFDTIFLNPIPYQLWFVRDLFLLCVFSPLLFFCLSNIKWILLGFLLICWFIDIDLLLLRNESILFFTIGAYFAIFNVSLVNKYLSKYAIYILIIWLLLLFVKISYIDSTMFHRFCIVIGVVATWFLYDKLNLNNLFKPRKIYAYSFFLFLIHEPMLVIVKKSLLFFLGKGAFSLFVVYFLATIITVSIGLSVAYIIKNKIPAVFSVLNGGR